MTNRKPKSDLKWMDEKTALTKNRAALAWMEEMAAMTQPDRIVWITGEEEQLETLRAQAVEEGILIRLNQDKLTQGYDMIVVARTRAVHAEYREIDRAFLRTCGKLGLMEKKA